MSNYLEDITNTMIKLNIGGYFLGLDEKMWANAIQKAIEIPEETLIENANHIINMCSSKIIDAEYLDKINGLINNKY